MQMIVQIASYHRHNEVVYVEPNRRSHLNQSQSKLQSKFKLRIPYPELRFAIQIGIQIGMEIGIAIPICNCD